MDVMLLDNKLPNIGVSLIITNLLLKLQFPRSNYSAG